MELFKDGEIVEVAHFNHGGGSCSRQPIWNVKDFSYSYIAGQEIIWIKCSIIDSFTTGFSTVDPNNYYWNWSQPNSPSDPMLQYIRRLVIEIKPTRNRIDNIVRRINGLHPHPRT